jgi:hypothetical protein
MKQSPGLIFVGKAKSSGLCYKNTTNVNDNCKLTTSWNINLDFLIRLLVIHYLPIMLLENIDSTGITHDDRHLQSSYLYSTGRK